MRQSKGLNHQGECITKTHPAPQSTRLAFGVAKGAIAESKGRILAIAILNLGGTVAGAAAIAGLVMYARSLESGEPVQMFGWTWQVLRQPRQVFGLAALLAIAGTVSAVCVYLANWLIASVSVQYSRKSTERLLRIAADPEYAGWAFLLSKRGSVGLAALSGRPARLSGMILRRLLQAMLPAIVFVIACASLFIISPLLTLVLLPICVAYLFPLRYITRRVVHYERELLKSNRLVRLNFRDAVDGLGATQHDTSRAERQIAETLANPEVRHVDRMLFRRLVAADRMQLTNSGFFVLCTFVLFGYFAMQAVSNGHSWSQLLLYIIALRFAVTELRRITAYAILINRYVPLYATYRAFLLGAEELRHVRAAARTSGGEFPQAITLNVPEPGKWQSADEVTVRPGEVLWVFVPWKPDPHDLEAVAVQLHLNSAEHVNILANATIISEQLIDAFALAWQSSRENDRLKCEGDAAEVPLTTAVRSKTTTDVNETHLLPEHARVVVCSAHDLGRHAFNGLLLHGQDRVIVLVGSDPAAVMDSGFRRGQECIAGAVVIQDGHLVAGGPRQWLQESADAICANLRQRLARMDESDDDDEDQDLQEVALDP